MVCRAKVALWHLYPCKLTKHGTHPALRASLQCSNVPVTLLHPLPLLVPVAFTWPCLWFFGSVRIQAAAQPRPVWRPAVLVGLFFPAGWCPLAPGSTHAGAGSRGSGTGAFLVILALGCRAAATLRFGRAASCVLPALACSAFCLAATSRAMACPGFLAAVPYSIDIDLLVGMAGVMGVIVLV